MKVLHVLNEFRHFGNGIVNVAVDLACAQSGAGHVVAVASSGGEFVDLVQRHGVEHFRLDQERTVPGIARAALELRRVLRDFRPDVVHAHMMTGAVLSVAVRGRSQYRVVTTVHNEYQRSAVLMGLGDRVVCVSAAVERAMRRRLVPARRLRVVRNGTIGTPRRMPLEDSPPAATRRPAIVSVGFVSHRKGSDVVVEAFSQLSAAHPEAHLYLVGNRDWPELERQVATLPGSERVHFEGFVPEPQTYLLACDVFVLASRQEPFGLVLAEAREAGVAIVGSDVDGIPEALDGGRAGQLVPAGDVSALRDVLAGLLADPSARSRWAAAAAADVSALTVGRMALEYEAVYRELVLP